MRLYFYLMVAFAAWSGVIYTAGNLPDVIGKGGIIKPGLAVQFASSSEDVDNAFTLKPPVSPAVKDIDLRGRVRLQQYLDFVFIVLYALVFYLVIGRTLRASGTQVVRGLGTLVCILIILAAAADFLEDFAILHVLRSDHPAFWPLWFGVPKWIAFFLAMGCSAALFLARSGNAIFSGASSEWLSFLVMVSGVLLPGGALLGLIGLACLSRGCGYLVPTGAAFILLPMIVLLVQCGSNAGIFGSTEASGH
ncbi:MAG: hypothetical protein LAP21_10915 [Acidobacteriia bacterium]|nr:hypothetical protein [Terriglobia bacterium]